MGLVVAEALLAGPVATAVVAAAPAAGPATVVAEVRQPWRAREAREARRRCLVTTPSPLARPPPAGTVPRRAPMVFVS